MTFSGSLYIKLYAPAKQSLRRLDRLFHLLLGYLFFFFGFFYRIRFDKVRQGLKRRVINELPKPKGLKYEIISESDEEVWSRCLRTNVETGFWPLSFSVPNSISLSILLGKEGLLCPSVPGDKYQFYNELDYLRNYGNYYFAVTHKKGGWDCLRHLEIFAAGSIPLMLDAKRIPSNTMVHYPKAQMAAIVSHFMASPDLPSNELLESVRNHYERHLTQSQMANYLCRVIGADRTARFLFVDRSLKDNPDYLSIFTLMGLKQILGDNLHVAFEPMYLYDDWKGPVTDLYGRGFSYAKKLSKTKRKQIGWNFLKSSFEDLPYDFIIIGNLQRNTDFVSQLGMVKREKLILIDGEDRADIRLCTEMQRRSRFIFVRELH